jgi:plasmid stabilization system protein ParE
MAYRLTARARREILRIWAYIAEDSETAADRFIDPATCSPCVYHT